MNGREKVQRQIRVGTRPLVEAIDNLRLTFGFENVKSLTPIVESKLRNGNVPQRPLQVSFNPIDGNGLSCVFTIPVRFPEEPYYVGIQTTMSVPVDKAEEYAGLEEYIGSISSQYSRSVVDGARAVKDVLVQPANNWLLSLCRDSEHVDIVVEDDEEVDVNEDKECVEETVEEKPAEDDDAATYFSCRICSAVLFEVDQIAHKGAKKGKCSSIFVQDAPDYLVMKSEEQEGKIYCPKCESRVGAWSWVGSRCSCKEWIAPSFQFVISKIDAKR